MNKVAIYRRYRPQTFDEVLGQNHIVGILKKAVKLEMVGHAYLFSGPRGTGKTSVARILAKEVGCSDIDLTEIDAASSRGIDEIRALREAVRFAPLRGNIKVYIIDEVHMLTKDAFNALLKTLEEPPPHVIFIMATTEPEKIPETIISRCQNFSFHKIPENILRESIVRIGKKEGFDINEEAAGLIALFAEGSFRDAQSLLDQITSMGEKKIDGELARKYLAAPPRELLERFIASIFEKKSDEGLAVIQEVAENNIDANLFIKLILRDIRAMLLMKMSPGTEKHFASFLGEREFEFLKGKKDAVPPADLELALKVLLETYGSKTNPYLPQLPLEMALLKINSR